MTTIIGYQLGLVPYEKAYRLQHELADRRKNGQISDCVLLLEHLPVITLGRRGNPAHILAPSTLLMQGNIAVYRVERGGDATYHGPGQVVAYPIFDLHARKLGASDYMHRLEEAVIRMLADYGIQAHRREGYIGVWVNRNKICAMGVRIRHGVTLHGLALNVNPCMAHWSLIVPCGIRDGGVTSIAQEIGVAPSDVPLRLAEHLAHVFSSSLTWGDPATLPWEAAMARDAPEIP